MDKSQGQLADGVAGHPHSVWDIHSHTHDTVWYYVAHCNTTNSGWFSGGVIGAIGESTVIVPFIAYADYAASRMDS